MVWFPVYEMPMKGKLRDRKQIGGCLEPWVWAGARETLLGVWKCCKQARFLAEAAALSKIIKSP